MRVNHSLLEVGDYCIIDYGVLQYRPLSELTDISGINSHVKLSQSYKTSKNGKDWDTWQPTTSGWLQRLTTGQFLRVRYELIQNLIGDNVIINSYEILQDRPQTQFMDQNESILLSKTNNLLDMQEASHRMVKLEVDLNYYLNQASCIVADYWHTNPDENSTDTILKEYSLHNVVSHKKVKCVVKDNQVPEPRHEFSQWGIEFEKLEIYFEKTYFEETFGLDVAPRANDYIYFHELNRMYYITDCFLQHGLAERGTYYVCSIKKYENNTAVEKSESDLDFLKQNLPLDSYTDDDIEEMEDITNSQQNLEKETIVDVVRQYTDVQLKPVNELLYNNGNDISLFYYPMNFKAKDNGVAVRYNKPLTIAEDGGTSIMFWIKVESIEQTIQIIRFKDVSGKESIIEYSNRKVILRPNIQSDITFSLPVKLIEHQWTCMVLSINNAYNYWSVHSYVIRPAVDKTPSLQCITKKEAKLILQSDGQLDKATFHYTIDKATIELLAGDYAIRMIRIADHAVSPELHSYVMASRTVSKPSQFVVIDDCEPNLRHYNVGESLFPAINEERDNKHKQL